MNTKIRVQIFGVKAHILSNGCGCSRRDNGCNNCGIKKSCGDCNDENDSRYKNGVSSNCGCNELKLSKTLDRVYKDLENFIQNGDLKDNIELKFIELDKLSKAEIEKNHLKVKKILDRGYEPPITVIDGIVRYYGGISNDLIYKDVKELLE